MVHSGRHKVVQHRSKAILFFVSFSICLSLSLSLSLFLLVSLGIIFSLILFLTFSFSHSSSCSFPPPISLLAPSYVVADSRLLHNTYIYMYMHGRRLRGGGNGCCLRLPNIEKNCINFIAGCLALSLHIEFVSKRT